MASHRKNGQTWYAASLKTTNPCARLPLSTACPTKPLDVSFVLLATTEQDKPLSSPLPVFEDASVRCDSQAVTQFTTCSYVVCIEPHTFFSHAHTPQICLFLVHCLSLRRNVPQMLGNTYRQSVAEQGGRNTGHTWTGDGKKSARMDSWIPPLVWRPEIVGRTHYLCRSNRTEVAKPQGETEDCSTGANA